MRMNVLLPIFKGASKDAMSAVYKELVAKNQQRLQ